MKFHQVKQLLNAFENGQISKEQFIEYLGVLSQKFNEFEDNYATGQDRKPMKDSSISYEKIANRVAAYYEHEKTMQYYYNNDMANKDEILAIQQLVRNEFGKEITEYAIWEFMEVFSNFEFGTYDINSNSYKLDAERFKQICKTKKFVGYTFPEYIDNNMNYFGSDSNITLSSIIADAELIESEYARYNYDIHNSAIGDLISQSEQMIQQENKDIKVVKKKDKILLKNSTTGEKRVLDLNQLTSKLDEDSKQLLLSCINGMSNLVLWEMAIEACNSFECDAVITSTGQYFIDSDHIGINSNTTTYSLTHEMIHAMMATVIDGQNTFNEPLYKNLLETFKKEKKEHHKKGLEQYELGGYNYCGENIHEFAAEAGCLYLTGNSVSQFTIAKHFPQTYRIFVELIDKIRHQDSGRNINL